ncbi:MAG: hypothetical protein KKD05_00960 [Candidatus Omnitrophica bacterium]|nr:hypothetical protein [Candidatus Omnitrophota bacterium]
MINKGLYNFILGVLVVLVMVSFVSVKGFCAVPMLKEDKQEKPIVKEDADVAATPDTVERPKLQETRPVENKQNAVSEKANTTGIGLYKAGYTVGQAVDILDNTYNPAEVRIACIKAGYSAADVDSVIQGDTEKVSSRTDLKSQTSSIGTGVKEKTILATTKPALDKTQTVLVATTKPALDKTMMTPVEKYTHLVEKISALQEKMDNGGKINKTELTTAVNELADFLKSNACNELTTGQQNHLLNKFSKFTNDLLFDSDNNKIGNQDILKTVVNTYSARLNAAENNEVLANVIVRMGNSVGKLGAANNKEANKVINDTLGKWAEKNDAKIKSLVADVNAYVSNPTADGAKFVGLKAGAVLGLAYHQKDKLKAFNTMITACANLMKSESFDNVAHKGGVLWHAAGVINKHILNSDSASRIGDIITGKASANGDASMELVGAYFGAVKDIMVAGGIEGEDNSKAFRVFHVAFQSMSHVLNHMSRVGSAGTVEKVAEHMFKGVASGTLQAYINVASAKIGDSGTAARAKVSYSNGLINLLTYGKIGNADIDVSAGSENFNKVITTAQGLVADKTTMLKVRDLRAVNNFIEAISELSNLVLTDQSLTMEQKENYAATFGDMFKSVLTFQEGADSVNPSSYAGVKENGQIRFNAVIANLNSKGYDNLADKMKASLKDVF